jgi:hypothetical protein
MSGAHVRVWFRGQTNDEWDLAPGVYRSDFPAKKEAGRLNLEQHLTQDFRVMAAGMLSGNESAPELYFLQQHYRMRTRLLDWTTNGLAGLYFAVSGNDGADGALFVMDASQLGRTQKAKYANRKPFHGIATSRNPLFIHALSPIFHWRDLAAFPSFIVPVRPDYSDRRITLQRGCFTSHVPGKGVLTKGENETLRSFRIPAKCKATILKQLSMLGIDDFSIYGDLDHLSTRLKAAYGIPS